ncbi:MAG: ABC transporter ATP-binding protein/permease [Eubacterium sp.]|nr:ABC transporter ATP-binding protein/permease [Eubacterium sp.]
MDDLLVKLPLREHFKNMAAILKYVRGMDRWYFPITSISLLLKAAVPYMELVLSAYILDGIGAHTEFRKMLAVAGASVLAILFVQFVSNGIYHKMEVRREQMYYLYECETQTRMLEMDFSKIDSPKVKELKDRIRKDNNWGAGIYSVFWQFDGIVENIFHLIGAVVVGLPVVGYMIHSKTAVCWLILAALIIIQIVSMRLQVSFRKQGDYWRYHEAKSVEEKEETFCFAWDFALQESYHYKNGKDIRLYGSYDLMERWTTEVLRHKGFRDMLLRASLGDGADHFLNAMTGGMIDGFSYLIVVVIAFTGTITVGNVMRFAGCLGRFLRAALNLVHGISDLALTARKQLSTLELIHMQDEMYKGKLPVEKRSDGAYRIEFRNVSFRYPGTEQYALKNLSMELTVGEKLAIVGMNGSGKTTMIKLLCRLYDPQEGEILLNGVDIKKFKQEEYSRLFSVVFQDFTLYPFPLGQNVAVSDAYDGEAVRKCLKDADFGECLDSMEKGLDTYLYKDYNDDGIEISGGEAQKIAIARAIYKEAPFILLDEPTAALDPLAEYEIYSNFDKITGTKTAVYISHRLSSCRFCEKIAVFHEGELVQMGSHEELVTDRSGKYYELWSAQAQYYGEDGKII